MRFRRFGEAVFAKRRSQAAPAVRIQRAPDAQQREAPVPTVNEMFHEELHCQCPIHRHRRAQRLGQRIDMDDADARPVEQCVKSSR